MQLPPDTTLDVKPDAPPEDLEDARLRAALGARLFGRDETVRIGRFEIRARLGAGGMGVVYAAHDPTLQREVALKVVRPDRDDPRLHRRLLREARAAAGVTHPNLVTIYDVGEHEGAVWIAMELIEGPTLDRWLADTRPPWRTVLRVFLAAGEGLAAVHARGIVHRDFKPTNVLIGDPARGPVVPRVVDFGIAQLGHGLDTLDGPRRPEDQDPEDTATHQVVGTPAYMAPEQLTGAPVDERADQFSFCVALFEALVGRRPFMGDTVAQIMARVASGDLSRPARWMPRWLAATLRRGLSLDPADRFTSMNELLGGLRRGLDRRRRVGLAGGAIALAAATSLSLLWYPADPCAVADNDADAVWNDTVAERTRAWFRPAASPYRAASAEAFLGGVDDWIGRWRAMRVETCRAAIVAGQQSGEVRDLRDVCLTRQLRRVDAMLRQIGAEKADPPQIARTVAAAFELPDLRSCEHGPALYAAYDRGADPDRRAKLEELEGELSELEGLFLTAEPRHVVAKATALRARAERLAFAPAEARAALVEARARLAVGERGEALASLTASFRAAVRASADELAADAALMAAWTRIENHDELAEAHRWLDDADAFVAAAGELPRQRATHFDYGAVLAYIDGDWEAAAQGHRRAIALREGRPGQQVAEAQSRINLAGVIAQQGDPEAALDELARAGQILTERVGAQHPLMAKLLTNRGSVLLAAERDEEALTSLEAALAIKEAVFGPDAADLAVTLVNLSNVRWSLDDRQGAIADLERAIAIRVATLGPDHERLAIPWLNLAASHGELARHDRAEAAYRRAIEILALHHDDAHVDMLYARAGLAGTLLKLGRASDALDTLTRVLPHLETSKLSVAQRADLHIDHALALTRLGRDGEARASLAKAVAACAVPGAACAEDPEVTFEDRLAQLDAEARR